MDIFINLVDFYIRTEKDNLEDLDKQIENTPVNTQDFALLLTIKKRETVCKLDLLLKLKANYLDLKFK